MQNQLLNDSVRQGHFTIEAVNEEADDLVQNVKTHLLGAVF